MGRPKGDNFELIFACDTLNTSSWFPFQPKDELFESQSCPISLIRLNYLIDCEPQVPLDSASSFWINIFKNFLNNGNAKMQPLNIVGDSF